MIRYPVTKEKLEELIAATKSDWLERAALRTEEFRGKGRYEEKKGIWSEVKMVYMRLQGQGKCAYCEREMESVEFGKVEQDVEHFRPKGRVKAWKAAKELREAGIFFAEPPALGKGYHLLPYHLFNDAAACKPCNSTLKKDYFPIAGEYDLDALDPADLADEKAYLIYPIGDGDEDPENLIEFHGTSPRPVAADGFKRHRALVTIAFFKLDHAGKRKNLYRDRALLIMALLPLLETATNGSAAAMSDAKKALNKFLKPELRHLNCARNFTRLFETNPVEAKAIYDAAVQLLASMS